MLDVSEKDFDKVTDNCVCMYETLVSEMRLNVSLLIFQWKFAIVKSMAPVQHLSEGKCMCTCMHELYTL